MRQENSMFCLGNGELEVPQGSSDGNVYQSVRN